MTGISALNRCLIGLVTVVICLASPARAATMRLALDRGQVFTWDWKTSRSTETEGRPIESGAITMPITLRVLDRTRDGYLLEIQHGRMVFDPTVPQSIKDGPEMAELRRVFETLKVRFLVTMNGEIKDIVNFDDVKEAGRKTIEMGAPNVGVDREVLLLMFERLAGSRESLRNLFLNDAGLFFYGTNLDPQIRQSVDFETERQNVFGCGPLKATGQLILKRVDRENKSAEIRVEQEADKQSFIQIAIKSYVAVVGKELPKDELEKTKQNASMRDAIEATVSLDSALATHAKRVRIFVIGNTVRIDQDELTLRK